MNRPLPSPDAKLRVIRELLTPPLHRVRPDATAHEILDAFGRDPRSLTAYCVDDDRLEGVIPFRALRRAIHPRLGARFPGLAGLAQRAWSTPTAQTARDLARHIPPVTLDTPIRDALFHMDIHRIHDLPIAGPGGALTLELTHGAHARLLADLLDRNDREAARARRPSPGARDTPPVAVLDGSPPTRASLADTLGLDVQARHGPAIWGPVERARRQDRWND